MGTRSAIITGTGMSVPSRIMTNRDLEKIVDTSDEWIQTRTGIQERRIAMPNEAVSEFALQASQQALTQLEQLSDQQGSGQVTLFFAEGSAKLDQEQQQRP